jgi:surface antigen
MTIDEFFNLVLNHWLDWDGAYQAQCVDLTQFYNKAIGNNTPFWGNAKDIFTQAGSFYTQVNNTPTGVPVKGDVIVWNGNKPFTGGNGHVAIASGVGDINTFQAWSQNDPTGSKIILKTYNYDYVSGWLHPKNVSSGGSDIQAKYDKLVQAIKNFISQAGI